MSEEKEEALTDAELEKLRDLLESWDNVRVGVRAVSLIGKVLSWVGGIAVAIVGIWSLRNLK